MPLSDAEMPGPGIDLTGELKHSGLSAICMTFATDYQSGDKNGQPTVIQAVEGGHFLEAILRECKKRTAEVCGTWAYCTIVTPPCRWAMLRSRGVPAISGYSAVLVRLSRVTPDTLRDLLGMAHKFVTRKASARPSARKRR